MIEVCHSDGKCRKRNSSCAVDGTYHDVRVAAGMNDCWRACQSAGAGVEARPVRLIADVETGGAGGNGSEVVGIAGSDVGDRSAGDGGRLKRCLGGYQVGVS